MSASKNMCQCSVYPNIPHTELAPVQKLGIFLCESCVSGPYRAVTRGGEKGKAPTVAGDVGFVRLLFSWEETSMLTGYVQRVNRNFLCMLTVAAHSGTTDSSSFLILNCFGSQA